MPKELSMSNLHQPTPVSREPGSPVFSEIRHALFAMILAVVMLAASTTRAEWKTETYDLVPGWNSIYLHIDPSHTNIATLLTDTPVSQVWLWTPTLSDAQFVTSPSEPLASDSKWLSWDVADADDSELENFIGNAGYLVYVESDYVDVSDVQQSVSIANPFVLSLTGKAVPPVYRWTASGQNFVGFPTKAGSEPEFGNFFELAPTLDTSLTEVYEYVGGEIADSQQQVTTYTNLVQRGRAYWVRDSDYNRFYGTFSLTLQDSSGVHFGSQLGEYRIRLENLASTANSVTFKVVDSETPADGSTQYPGPPILVQGALDSTSLTFSFTELDADGTITIPLAATGEADSVVDIVLGVDRAAMTQGAGSVYGSILRFTDNFGDSANGYTEIDVPTTAVVGSSAGLWVGEAKITQVQQDVAEYEVDDDGATALDDSGASVVSSTDSSFGGVARSYSLRLIMHLAEDGTTKLLQRVYYGLDDDSLPMLATSQDLLNADHLDVARRITAVHLPWSTDNATWQFDKSLDSTSTLTASIATSDNDHAANPFLHTYHPDHDNKDAEFSLTQPVGVESYQIVRDITLNAGKTLVSSASTTTSTTAETTSDSTTSVIPSLPSGITMVELPQGSFKMGDENATGTIASDHLPERTVYISPFEMSEAEITVQQYVDFLNAAKADGLIEVFEESDGTFVYGITEQSYLGHKFIELSGSRVLKDHDGDGDIDPENPLNQCWIEYDGVGTFSVKDPAAIDWGSYEYTTGVGLTAADFGNATTMIPGTDPTPVVLANGASNGDGGTFNLDGARHAAVADGFAYVGSSLSDTLTVLKVSDPAQPEFVREIGGLDNPLQVRLAGEYLYVTAYGDGAVVMFNLAELTDPDANVTEVARLNDGDESTRMATTRCSAVVEVSGTNYLYVVGDEDYLVIFDITDPGAPVLKTEMQLTDGSTTYTNFKWVEISEGVAYVVSSSQDSVLLLNIADDPENPAILSVITDGDDFPSLDNPQNVVVSDGILYVAGAGDDAVSIISVTNSATPVLLSELKHGVDGYLLDGGARNMALADGNILYVPAPNVDAVSIVNVRDPSNPVLIDVMEHGVGNFAQLDQPMTVAVDDEAVFIMSYRSDALNIVPHSETVSLLRLSPPAVAADGGLDANGATYALQGPREVVGADGVAYVANYSSGNISVLDVSDPANISVLSVLEHNVDSERLSGVNSLTLADDLLIATAWFSDTITIYDVSGDNRTNPDRQARIIDNSSLNLHRPITTALSGDYLYISNVGAGDSDAITIYDISDPGDPQFVTEIISGQADLADPSQTVRVSNVSSMQVVDDVLYATTGDSWITIMNVKDPANPTLLLELNDGEDGFNHVTGPGSLLLQDDILYFKSGSENAVTIAGVTVTHDSAGVPTSIALEKLVELVHGDGTYAALEAPGHMVLDQGLLYVPALTSGAVTVIDVFNPASPVLLEELVDGSGGYVNLDGANSVALVDNTVLVTAVDANALTVVAPADIVGQETFEDWPELADNPPLQSEVATWPATFIKWHGAKAFAEYYGADLPTEAQWEYAAKGGADQAFATATGTVDATQANYNEADQHPDSGHVEPVKSYAANPFGLYDMSGNVWEWCRDWYNPSLYSSSSDPDYDPYVDSLVLNASEPLESDDPQPTGKPGEVYDADARVKRGGSWNFHESSLGTAARERDYTWRGNDHFGFRIVRESYSLETVSADDFAARTSSSTQLSGVYQERITLTGKDSATKEYNVAGEFTLIRITDIAELKTKE